MPTYDFPRNKLLAVLDPPELAVVMNRMELVKFPFRHVLVAPDDNLDAAYFPEGGWVSMLLHLEDGDSAEVGPVGSEGMIGLPLLLGASSSVLEAVVHEPATMLRMGAGAFQKTVDEIPAFRKILLRYSLTFQEQVIQAAACNGHHSLNQRLACALLMSHDRAQSDKFSITHEALAIMLCAHRPGVTLAARLLKNSNLIAYSHGQMIIVDRPGLEEASCECYGAVNERFKNLRKSLKR